MGTTHGQGLLSDPPLAQRFDTLRVALSTCPRRKVIRQYCNHSRPRTRGTRIGCGGGTTCMQHTAQSSRMARESFTGIATIRSSSRLPCSCGSATISPRRRQTSSIAADSVADPSAEGALKWEGHLSNTAEYLVMYEGDPVRTQHLLTVWSSRQNPRSMRKASRCGSPLPSEDHNARVVNHQPRAHRAQRAGVMSLDNAIATCSGLCC